jgi:hypothetical protein
VAVLPRASRINESSVTAAALDPVLHLLRHELASVVALHHPGRAVQLDELIENANHIHRRELTGALDPESLARELIDHRQETKRSPVDRLIRHEVVAPHVIRMQSHAGAGRARSASTPFRALPRHPQPLSPPQQTHTFPPHTPSLHPQPMEDLSVSETWIPFRQPMKGCDQLDFFRSA